MSARYKAFISYKHGKSSDFARCLEQTLKAYAKPTLKPPLRIFRDERHLKPGISLPKLIVEALDNSEFLILLASPEASRSEWVKDEISKWCSVDGRVEKLIIVLTEGEISVDSRSKTICWDRTDALPDMLRPYLNEVPLFLDARELVASSQLTIEHQEFKRQVNAIAAAFRGIDPNDMLGEEVREHARNIRLRNLAIGSLALMLLISVATAWIAIKQREQARAQAIVATTRQLAAESGLALERGLFDQALRLAAAAFRTKTTPESEGALLNAVAATSSLKKIIRGLQAQVKTVVLHPNGRWIAVLYESGAVDVWDVLSGLLVAQPLSEGEPYWSIEFTADGKTLVIGAQSGEQGLIVWDTRTLATRKLPPNASKSQFVNFALSVDGSVAMLGGDSMVAFQDLNTGAFLSESTSVHLRRDLGNFVNALATSPDGKYAVTGAADGGIVLWNMGTRRPLGQVMRSNEHSITTLAFLPDGKRFISLNDHGEAVIWDITTRKPLARHSQQLESVRWLDLTRDGLVLISMDQLNRIRLLNSLTGRPLDGIPQVMVRSDSALAITNDRKTLVTASREAGLLVWDLVAPEFLRRDVARLPKDRSSYCLSETGKLVWATPSGQVEILDLVSSHRRHLSDLGVDGLSHIALDSGGTRLVAVDSRGRLYVRRFVNGVIWGANA